LNKNIFDHLSGAFVGGPPVDRDEGARSGLGLWLWLWLWLEAEGTFPADN